MAQIFDIQLTVGNSEGNYDIYWDQIGSSYLATAYTTNTLTVNLSFTLLNNGIRVAVPNSATRIIIYGLSCQNQFVYDITPIDEPPPNFNPTPICFSYGEFVITQYLDFTPNGISSTTGRLSWSSGSYSINWSLQNNRWELILSPTLTFVNTYTSTDGIPEGNWVGLGLTGKDYIGIVTLGICSPIETNNISGILEQTPNSCYRLGKDFNVVGVCDGVIRVTNTSGGQPPYTYSLDGVTFQTSPIFSNLCPILFEVIIKDSLDNTYTNSITVGNGPQPTNYNLSLISQTLQISQSDTSSNKQTKWILDTSSLPPSVRFTIQLIFDVTSQLKRPGEGSILNTIQVYKNTTTLLPDSNDSSSQTSTRPDCPYTITTTTNQKIYTIDVTFGDIVSGTTNSILTLTTPLTDASCSTELNTQIDLNSSITSLTCSCCEVVTFEYQTIITNVLKSRAINTSPSLNTFCLNYGRTCYDALNP